MREDKISKFNVALERLIAMSIGKLAHKSRKGVDLHRNLLIVSVIRRAKTVKTIVKNRSLTNADAD